MWLAIGAVRLSEPGGLYDHETWRPRGRSIGGGVRRGPLCPGLGGPAGTRSRVGPVHRERHGRRPVGQPPGRARLRIMDGGAQPEHGQRAAARVRDRRRRAHCLHVEELTSPVPLVLAIEPDLRQAAIVKRIVRENGLADVAVVDSRDAALEAMRTTVPDVLLISALLSPRDEDELVAHLRTLDDADHLQTHTIPQLASALRP